MGLSMQIPWKPSNLKHLGRSFCVMKFKFLHEVHFNSHPWTMSTPQSSSQQAAPAQEPKIQGLQINMALFIHPSFQIFHGTHHKLHSFFLKYHKHANLWLTKSKTIPPPPFFLMPSGDFSLWYPEGMLYPTKSLHGAESRRAQVWQCLQPRALHGVKNRQFYI
jgi:hypothetical protein